MDKIEKIRQEIERHRQAIRVLNEHTAPEQMSKTCAIFQYSDSILSELNSFLDTLSEEPDKSLEEAANEFANQDCVTFISRKKGFIAGAEWQKQQMLKDAVEGEVMTNGFYPYEPRIVASYPNCPYAFGDKVCIIIVKEEE